MYKELFRLTKSKVLWFIFAIVIFIFFVFAMEYCLNSTSKDNYIYHSISEYISTDEIPNYISNLENVKTFLDSSDADYEQNLQNINQSIAIYNYLYKHEISYDEFKNSYSVYMGMFVKSDNRVLYTEYMLNISSALAALSLIACSTILVCYDFNSDLYKNIYGTNMKRSKIYKSKLSAYLIFAAIILIVLFLLTFITSFQCNILTANMICFFGNTLFVIKSSSYIALNYLMQVLNIVPFVALIFGFASSIKNTYVNLALCTLSCFIPLTLSYLNNLLGRNWYVLRMGLINMFNGFYPCRIFIIVFLIEVLISALLFVVGNKIFKKRNL